MVTNVQYVVIVGGRATVVDEHGLRDAMQRHGLLFSELSAHVSDINAGVVVTAEDGTDFALLEHQS
jgi:hypothetical protein